MDAESAYVFRHAVLRDAAYQLQLPTAREKLHVLALEVIESVAAKDELPHFAEELARHAQIGKRTDLEVVYLKMAAQFAAKQFRGADAAGLWARLGAHPGVNDETAISAFCDESALWVTVGSIPRAEAAVQAGRKRLAAWRSKGRTHREAVQLEARLALVLGNALAALPRKEEREAALLMACDLAKSVNDFAIASSALNQLVRHYDQAGDAVRSKQTAEQALLEAERSKDEVAIAVARNSRAVVDLNHGAIDAAIETWNDLLEKSFEIPVLARVQALNGLGNAMRAQGRHSDACEYYARGLREAQQAGAAPGIVLCQSNLAMSLMESGKLQEARNTYQKALASARESGSVSDEARVQVNLGNLLIALGEYSEAEECLRESVLLSRRLKHPIQEAFATGNFAPVLMSRGKLGMALRSFEVAKRLMEASGRANTAAVYAAMCAELKLMLQDIAGADAELAFASQRLTAAEDPAWYAEYILPARFRRAACDTPSAPMVARLEAVAATSKEFRISCGFESDSAAARAIQECEGALQEIRQAVAQHRTPLVLGGKLVRELNAEFRRAMVARADALGIKWDDDLSAAMRANIAAVQEPDWRSEDLTYWDPNSLLDWWSFICPAQNPKIERCSGYWIRSKLRFYKFSMETAMSTMTVGKLAKTTGINIETVRFYEREGLMPKPERTSGGHRLFNDSDVARLRFIQHAKDVGFTLKEIHDLLFLRDSEIATCEDVCEMAKRKVGEIDRKIAMLSEMRDHLKALTEVCHNDQRSTDCCAIIKGLEDGEKPRSPKGRSRK